MWITNYHVTETLRILYAKSGLDDIDCTVDRKHSRMVLIMLTVAAPVARASGSWQQAKASSDLDSTPAPVECAS
jgi:hypothetical protein